RTRRLHALLRLADLGCRDHLECARHLAGVLHRLDLGLDFAATSHFFARFARSTGFVGRDSGFVRSGVCAARWPLQIPNPESRIAASPRLLELADDLLELALDLAVPGAGGDHLLLELAVAV